MTLLAFYHTKRFNQAQNLSRGGIVCDKKLDFTIKIK